jgi:hypothetical protein
MHLPATGLARPELHLHAKTLQQMHHRAPGLLEQRVVIAGNEKRCAHAATQQNARVSIKKPNIYREKPIVYCNSCALAAASARVASAKLSKWAIGSTLSEFVSMVASPPHRMRPFSVFPGTGFSTFLAESRLTLRVSRFYPPQAAFLLILHPASIDRDVLSGFSRHWPGHPSYYDEVADQFGRTIRTDPAFRRVSCF